MGLSTAAQEGPSTAEPKCWGSDRGAAHSHPEGLARSCIFFFFFLRLFYSESVGGRPRIWGGTVNLLRKALQPGCSPGGEEEGAVNKLCDLPAQGMSA